MYRGTLGHFANVCRKTQTNSGNKSGHHTSQGSKSSFAAGKNYGKQNFFCAATQEALQVDKCLNKVTRKRIDIRPIQCYLVSGLRGPKYTNGRKHKRYKC